MNPNKAFNSNVLQKKSVCWLKLIDKLSHIFTNKLAVLRKKHLFLHKTIPSLLKGYQLAVDHKLMGPEISEPILENIASIINLEEEITPAFKVLDTVTSFCSQLSKNDTTASFSIRNCVSETLCAYTFKNNDRNCVQFNEGNDFNCFVPEFFIKATLTSLLRFVFSNFKELAEKSISIWTDSHDGKHLLHFKIASKNTQENYDHWFQNSLDVSSNEVNPGMNLCRLALLQHNSDITYQTIMGQLLKIIVTFPKEI